VGVQVDLTASTRSDARGKTNREGTEAPAAKRARTVTAETLACRHTPFRSLSDICIRCTERVMFTAAAKWPAEFQ
jgi:hypothetical protein